MFVILAILAAVTHFYRESIVRGFANSALHEQGFIATELSIQTLGTDFVRLSYLVLEQDDGTRYEISGLSFPLSFPSAESEMISIEQLVLVPAEAEIALPPLAGLLHLFLELPDSIPNTEITIAHLATPAAPSISNFVWKSTGQRQHLAFSALSVDVSIEVDRVNDSQHQVKLNAVVDEIPDAFSSTLSVTHIGPGFTIVGTSTTDLSPWRPLLQSIGLLDDDVVSINARLNGQIRIELNDDETISVRAGAHLSLADLMTSSFSFIDGSDIQLQVEITDSILLDFEYPSLDWTARAEQISMKVEMEKVSNGTAQFTDLECSSGIQCKVRVSVDTGPLELEKVAFSNAKLSALLEIATADTTRVDISPDLVLELTGIESQDFSVAAVSATQFSGGQLTIDDGSWRLDIDRMEFLLEKLANQDGMAISLPIAVGNLRIRDDGATVDADVSMLPNAATLSLPDSAIIMPGVRGTISLHDNDVTVSSELFDNEGTLSAHVNISHDIATGEGSISMKDAALRFDLGKLSRHFSTWPHAWDVVSGTLSSELELHWKIDDDGANYGGTMKYRANALAGNYDDIVFSGLNTELSGTLDSVVGMRFLPTTITVALLDVGTPVKQIAADFSLNVAEESIQVHSATMSVLGGHLVADPFLFRVQADRNDIVMRPKSIPLQVMADLAEYEGVQLSGSISGMLPMTIRENTITITDGRLASDPPGGVIRYLPGLNSDDDKGPVSDLGLVSRALANFQYESLKSDVNYTESGDLKLQMKLTGINPDMDPPQPIILNIGLENNIPQLLRSLQATRSIEDILERRGTN